MDDIYKGKTKEEIIELVYCLTKQNLSGRETHDEVFMKGIEFCYNELCEGKESLDELGNCNKPHVKARICSNCIYLYEDALAEYSGIEHRCNRLRMPVIAPDKMQCIYFGYAL